MEIRFNGLVCQCELGSMHDAKAFYCLTRRLALKVTRLVTVRSSLLT